jgi:acetoin utilization deacetylase AcuC-like enzyme
LKSAGFDAREAAPLTSLMVTISGFKELTMIIQKTADEVCNEKIVSILEGDYNIIALAESVHAHLAVLSS